MNGTSRRPQPWPVLGNLTVVLLLLFARGWPLSWVVPIAGALRIFGIAWSIATAPVYSGRDAEETVLDELGVADQPGAAAMATELADAERSRAPIDRAWTLSYIATLFAIHIGRMSTDLTLLGLLSPAVAVAGDMAIAVLFTLLVINPAYLVWRGPTRRLERWLWRRRQQRPETPRTRWLGIVDRSIDAWLRWRLAMAIRMRTGTIFGAGGARFGPAAWVADCRHSGGDRPDLGHELVLRYRELGGGHVELLGRVAH